MSKLRDVVSQFSNIFDAISSAAALIFGSKPLARSIETRAVGACIPSPATTFLVWSRIGTATAIRPTASSSLLIEKSRVRISSKAISSSTGSVIVLSVSGTRSILDKIFWRALLSEKARRSVTPKHPPEVGGYCQFRGESNLPLGA